VIKTEDAMFKEDLRRTENTPKLPKMVGGKKLGSQASHMIILLLLVSSGFRFFMGG
jgi:hypothetical protein